MRIDAPSREDIAFVAARMRKRELAEFAAVSPYMDPREMLASLPDRFGPYGYGFYLGDRPVGIGMMAIVRPNVATIGFFATDEFPKIALPLARFVRRHLFPNYRAVGVHRIDAYVSAANPQGMRWCETVGLHREATLRGFGRDGEDFHVYASVDFSVGRLYPAVGSDIADLGRPLANPPQISGGPDVFRERQ